MTKGIILLSADGYYIDEQGQLPIRPDIDKPFLLSMCIGQRILCSANTFKTLPNSILQVATYVTTNPKVEHDVNLGISTFRTAMPDVFYIIRSTENTNGGKQFQTIDLANHSVIFENKLLTILIRRPL